MMMIGCVRLSFDASSASSASCDRIYIYSFFILSSRLPRWHFRNNMARHREYNIPFCHSLLVDQPRLSLPILMAASA